MSDRFEVYFYVEYEPCRIISLTKSQFQIANKKWNHKKN